jgi:hypothetical protein
MVARSEAEKMIFEAKYMGTVLVAGMLAPWVQPALADATGVMSPMTFPEQFGVCGIFALLHWWTIAKTIPELSKKQQEGMDAVAMEIRSMRDDIKHGLNEQLDLMRSTTVEHIKDHHHHGG